MSNFPARAARICAVTLLPLLGAPLLAPSAAEAQVAIGLTINVAPPILPVYAQPALPGPGYIWTPGYWAWNNVAGDYYWVPGAWVLPPRVGLLWTPGWWGWSNGAYLFHGGYWGPTVGFYGGVNYGFGYTGSGFFGGEWRGGQYFYNSSVNNVRNVSVTNVYNKTVVVNNNAPRTSFNGGPNGIAARPTPADIAAHAGHVPPTQAQMQHMNVARNDPQARFSNNQGKPEHVAAERPVGAGPQPLAAAPHAPGAGQGGPIHPAAVGGAPAHQPMQAHGLMEPQHMQPRPAMAGGQPHPGPRPQAMMAMRRPMPPRPGPGPGCRGPHCR